MSKHFLKLLETELDRKVLSQLLNMSALENLLESFYGKGYDKGFQDADSGTLFIDNETEE